MCWCQPAQHQGTLALHGTSFPWKGLGALTGGTQRAHVSPATGPSTGTNPGQRAATRVTRHSDTHQACLLGLVGVRYPPEPTHWPNMLRHHPIGQPPRTRQPRCTSQRQTARSQLLTGQPNQPRPPTQVDQATAKQPSKQAQPPPGKPARPNRRCNHPPPSNLQGPAQPTTTPPRPIPRDTATTAAQATATPATTPLQQGGYLTRAKGDSQNTPSPLCTYPPERFCPFDVWLDRCCSRGFRHP